MTSRDECPGSGGFCHVARPRSSRVHAGGADGRGRDLWDHDGRSASRLQQVHARDGPQQSGPGHRHADARDAPARDHREQNVPALVRLVQSELRMVGRRQQRLHVRLRRAVGAGGGGAGLDHRRELRHEPHDPVLDDVQPGRHGQPVVHVDLHEFRRVLADDLADPPDRHGDRPVRAHSMETERDIRRTKQGGFSLIEVVFALTFLAIGILAVASMIPAGTRGVTQSRVLTSGLMAAQVKMEDLKGKDFTTLTAGTFTDTTSVFTRTWVITDSIPMAGCKKIDVTSRWTDSHGTESTQLVSYVSK